MAKHLIAVVDETGGAHPLDRDDSTFGVGAILYEPGELSRLSAISKEISKITGRGDYKYKHVQCDSKARKEFLRVLDAGNKRSTHAYGFYSAQRGVDKAEKRDADATEFYRDQWPSRDMDSDVEVRASRRLLRNFLNQMAPQFGAYAATHDLKIEVYWDTRTDWQDVTGAWSEAIEWMSRLGRYQGASAVKLVGQVSGPLNNVARLSGVLAGDLKCFFDRHGHRIWPHLDTSGLRSETDPMFQGIRTGPPERKVMQERLADGDYATGSNTTSMLQGYYKALLRTDQRGNGNLISFISPEGQCGLLRIDHGNRWCIHQLPD